MQWTRRHFLEITGGAAAALGLCAAGIGLDRVLAGHASFGTWRALPGMTLDLSIDVDSPEQATVEIVAHTSEGYLHVETLRGARQVRVEVPYIETSEDSYELLAVVQDTSGRCCHSDAVEVLAEPFMFGM